MQKQYEIDSNINLTLADCDFNQGFNKNFITEPIPKHSNLNIIIFLNINNIQIYNNLNTQNYNYRLEIISYFNTNNREINSNI